MMHILFLLLAPLVVQDGDGVGRPVKKRSEYQNMIDRNVFAPPKPKVRTPTKKTPKKKTPKIKKPPPPPPGGSLRAFIFARRMKATD